MSHRHFPFVVLEIAAQNMLRARTFYSSLFGWTFADSDVESGALEAELGADHDTMVRMHLRPGDAGRALGGQSVCVLDLAPILAGLVAAGGQLIAGPVDVPGLGRRLYVRDTEGNEVAVLEPTHESH